MFIWDIALKNIIFRLKRPFLPHNKNANKIRKNN